MKVNIKNLKGQIFSIEMEPSETICNLKQKIQAEKGIASQTQKIIFKGKTVKNQEQIQKLGLRQSDFLVVMGQVAKPQPKPKVEDKELVPQKVQEKKQEPKEQKKQEKINSKSEPAANQEQLNQLTAMGFPRQQCAAALKAAFNDSGRAVQYLINGIPSSSNQNPSNTPNPLSALNSLPQFQQIRSLIQSDPNTLPQILAQLAQTSPQLYNIIAQHPEEFQNLILQGAGAEIEQNSVEEQGQQANQGNQAEIAVSPQQEAAITRLSNLGFSKLQAAQAYIVCDKNEQVAANLLFDRLANGDIQQSFPGQGSYEEQEDDDNLFN